jgi:glycosyltransferase involved in cell wall biosynthesis
MKPKILYVIDNVEFGGGERGFLQLIKGLHNKFAISVAGQEGGVFYEELEALGIQFFNLEMSPQLSINRLLTLKNFIRQKSFDIIHGQGSRAEFYARVASKLAGNNYYVSTIQAPVDKFDTGLIKKNIYIFLDRLSDKLVKKFIVVSDELAEILAMAHKIETDKIIKIHNGIEVDRISPQNSYADFRKKYEISADIPLIGAIGRLIWAKGFPYLIEAFESVYKIISNAKLIIAGDGPMREELENHAKKIGLNESIIFAGFVKDIPSLINNIDVLAIPSLSEGLPMVTLEGMALAKPIVATGLPGILEQIENNNTGLIVPPKNSETLGDSLIDLLVNKEKALKLGRNARTYVVNKFSVETMIAKTEKVYNELLTR